VKKLLIFIFMLVVGMALFAVPVAGEPPGATITLNTVETVQPGVFSAVTDVSPVIALAENSCRLNILATETRKKTDVKLETIEKALLEAAMIDINYFLLPCIKEVIPFYGYSKTAVLKNGAIALGKT
jgi:hypothetical protein